LTAEAYGRTATVRAGTTSRSDAWWEVVYGPERSWLGGGPQLTVVHRDAEGRPDGYLLYSTDLAGGGWHGVPRGTVHVRELLGATAEAELALWAYATRVPLTRHVRWELAPVDTPVRWRTRDPRQLRTVAWRDMLWLRVLDVAALLERRSYDLDGRVTFEVGGTDDRVAGAWTLSVWGGVGRVTRGGRAEVSMDPAALGSVVLGGVGLGELAAAGHVSGERTAMARLAALLRSPVRPFSLSRF
jgi:predicted acetyltransferase